MGKGSVTAPRLGIGIITFKRPEHVQRTVEAVRRYTSHPHALVVADDGSGLYITGYVREFATVITGQNHGVTWNKNRAIFYLKTVLGCDIVILLEDDVMPTEYGWEYPWIVATLTWGHMNFAGPWFRELFVQGDGTASSPYLSKAFSGQCTSFSREALDYVGFLDTRYRGFGVGHVDHTHRLARLGYGAVESAEHGLLFRLLSSPLRVVESVSAKNDDEIRKNEAIFNESYANPVYRAPWSDDAELREFRAEQETAPDLEDFMKMPMNSLYPGPSIRRMIA